MSRLVRVLSLSAALVSLGCARTGEVGGQIFIVTKGGQNIKLGLVTVGAIKAEKLTSWVKETQDAVDKRIQKAKGLAEKAEAATDEDEKSRLYGMASSELSPLAGEELGKTLTKGLPAPDVSTKSDADGRFVLELPRGEKFALVAQASRMAGDETEHYFWLVWTPLEETARKNIMLSNDNLSGGDSAGAIIRMKL